MIRTYVHNNSIVHTSCIPYILSLNKGFPDAWSSYGGVLVKLGRWTEAVSALNKVLELRTDNPDLYCNVATYFEELGEGLAVSIGEHSSNQYSIYIICACIDLVYIRKYHYCIMYIQHT